MRRYFEKPFWLNFDQISHELLGGQDQLVIDDPFGQSLKHAGAGVAVDCVGILERAIVATFLQLGRIVEEPRSNCFTYVCVDVIIDLRYALVFVIYFNSFA